MAHSPRPPDSGPTDSSSLFLSPPCGLNIPVVPARPPPPYPEALPMTSSCILTAVPKFRPLLLQEASPPRWFFSSHIIYHTGVGVGGGRGRCLSGARTMERVLPLSPSAAIFSLTQDTLLNHLKPQMLHPYMGCENTSCRGCHENETECLSVTYSLGCVAEIMQRHRILYGRSF